VRLHGRISPRELRCLLAGRCGGFAGLVALVFGLRHALGATVGFFGCALALFDMLPKVSSPPKGGKNRVAECDNQTLAYFLLRRKLLGNLPESVAFSSLACLGVESNP